MPSSATWLVLVTPPTLDLSVTPVVLLLELPPVGVRSGLVSSIMGVSCDFTVGVTRDWVRLEVDEVVLVLLVEEVSLLWVMLLLECLERL